MNDFNERELYDRWIRLISCKTELIPLIEHLKEHICNHSKDDIELNNDKWFLSLFNLTNMISLRLIEDFDLFNIKQIEKLNEILYNKSLKYNNDFEKEIRKEYFKNH